MTQVTVDGELLKKVVSESTALKERLGSYSTGSQFYTMARELTPSQIEAVGLNIKRLNAAVEQLYAKAQQYTEVPGQIPGTGAPSATHDDQSTNP